MNSILFQDCHEEPIHTPGFIQPFGYLIVLDFEFWEILYCSENVSELFGEKAENLLGRRVREFPQIYDATYPTKNSADFRARRFKSKIYNPEIIKLNNEKFYYQLYSDNQYVFLEFEKVQPKEILQDIMLDLGNQILQITNEEELWNALCQEISDIIDYDRVMIYRFAADYSGEVVAECKKDGLESMLRIHYPESDIPAQARALYMKKRKRIVSDISVDNVAIITRQSKPLEMDYVSSRAMSPIHIEYLRNMGIQSSFSTSIIIDDKLWGLVTAHNHTPKHIDLYSRQISEILTRITANAYSSIKSKEQLKFTGEFHNLSLALKDLLLLSSDDTFDFSEILPQVKGFVDADGLAFHQLKTVKCLGVTPQKETIFAIADWILKHSPDDEFFNHRFKLEYPEFFDEEESTAGVMALIINREKKQMLIWFRNEKVTVRQWAAKSVQVVEPRDIHGEEKLVNLPRKTFEILREEIRNRSLPWTEKDITGITVLHNLLLQTSQKKNAMIEALNQSLQEKIEELDSFSYTVSHDLRTPLTVMALNAQQLLSKTAGDDQKSNIRQILDQVDDITEMMNDILNLSRVNKSEIQLTFLETEPIVNRVLNETVSSLHAENTQITTGEFSPVYADKTMLYQVFLNVIGNAVKYSSRTAEPKVGIHAQEQDNQIIYLISDNGIGISEDTRDSMFRLFSRQENAMEFNGSGVGLSIVKRLMNRMGGDVDFESELGKGTTFRLIFQKP